MRRGDLVLRHLSKRTKSSMECGVRSGLIQFVWKYMTKGKCVPHSRLRGRMWWLRGVLVALPFGCKFLEFISGIFCSNKLFLGYSVLN